MNFIAYASTVITNDDNKILLVREKKQKNYNKLNLPGGHMELWESPMEGAIREALEEVGVEIDVNWLIGIYLGRNTPSFHYVFAGKIKHGRPKASPEEILSIEWYSVEEIMNLPKEEYVYIEKLRDIIEKYQTKKLIAPQEIIIDMKKL